MRYFIRKSVWYSPKNRLHAAIYAELDKLDGNLVNSRDLLEKMITEAKMKVEKMCTEHTRCKPTKMMIYRERLSIESRPVSLGVSGLIHLHVSEVKREVQP